MKPVDLTLAATRTAEFDADSSAEAVAACDAKLADLYENLDALYGALDTRFRDTYSTAGDLELGLHALALRSFVERLNDLRKRADALSEFNDRRIGKVLESRNSEGFRAHGRTFTADGELLPSAPAKGSAEYEAFLAALRDHGIYDKVMKTTAHWPSLRGAVNDLAANGEALPGVKLSPKLKVRIT